MKNFLFLTALLFFITNSSIAQDCYPNKDGQYMYYVNMTSNKINNKFDKSKFINLIATSPHATSKTKSELEKELINVEKSFPTAVTDILQRSVTIYSDGPDLEESLKIFTDQIGLVEKICLPKRMLLYEPNDYAINNSHHRKSHLDLINAPGAWDITKGSSEVLIGISDTHLDENHEDLANKIAVVLQNNNSTSSHGTHVAGCAASDTDNKVGNSAVGFNSSIAFTSNWANDNEVLEMAQVPGVKVINCSWINSCGFSTTQNALYQEIRDVHNVVVTAGAGNNSTHCGENAYVYPAAYESVISVTSVGHINEVGFVHPTWGASNWMDCHENIIGDESSTHHHNDKVNIAAPGYNVFSPGLDNSYGGAWGTSFAAPIVAGVCALVASLDDCLTAAEIQTIVLESADASLYSIPENADYVGLLGTGRVDALAAVSMALGLTSPYKHSYTGQYNDNHFVDGQIAISDDNEIFYRGTNGFMSHFWWNGVEWVHDQLVNGNQPTAYQMAPESPMVISSSGIVFYRGADNRMQHYWKSGSTWHHSYTGSYNANHFVDGDIAITNNNVVIYRAASGFMHRFWWDGNSWENAQMGVGFQPESYLVSPESPIAISDNTGTAFYKGLDGRMQHYYPSGASWKHAYTGSYNDNHFVDGAITYANNQLFYRAIDGYMNRLYWNGGWQNDQLTNAPLPKAKKVSPESPIVVSNAGNVFYIGGDMRMQHFTPSGGMYNHHYTGLYGDNHFVDGDIAISPDNEIMYRSADGFIHRFWWDGEWHNDQLVNTAQNNAYQISIESPIIISSNGLVFYKGLDARMQHYYRNNPCNPLGPGLVVPDNELEYATSRDYNSSGQRSKQFSISAFPNPTQENVTLSIQHSENLTYEKFDIFLVNNLGQTLLTNQIEKTNDQLNINIDMLGFPAGVYFLQVRNQEGITTTKQIVKI